MSSIPNHDSNSNRKMGIMVTASGVHIVMGTAMEKLSFLVLSIDVAAAV